MNVVREKFKVSRLDTKNCNNSLSRELQISFVDLCLMNDELFVIVSWAFNLSFIDLNHILLS